MTSEASLCVAPSATQATNALTVFQSVDVSGIVQTMTALAMSLGLRQFNRRNARFAMFIKMTHATQDLKVLNRVVCAVLINVMNLYVFIGLAFRASRPVRLKRNATVGSNVNAAIPADAVFARVKNAVCFACGFPNAWGRTILSPFIRSSKHYFVRSVAPQARLFKTRLLHAESFRYHATMISQDTV